MANVLEGWLRIAGEKFYAITRPSAVKIDEEKTLEDVLDKFNVDEINSDIKALQRKIDALRADMSEVQYGIGAYNIQTGVYTAHEDDISTLSAAGRLDDNILYIVTNNTTYISRVHVRVVWKNPSGDVLDTYEESGKIGSTTEINFYRLINKGGHTYSFKPSKCPVIDISTGAETRQIIVPPDGSPNATLYHTKNVVLEIVSENE